MSSSDEDEDRFAERLEELLTYNPPLSDSFYRRKDPEHLGTFPVNFYDRHVDDDVRLKRVVLLPSLATDLSRQVDEHLEDLKRRSDDHLPLTDDTMGDFSRQLPRTIVTMQMTAWNLAMTYADMEQTLTTFVSHWLISPNFPEYASTLAFNSKYIGHIQSRDDPMVSHSLRFLDASRVEPELLAHLDESTRDMLLDLQGKSLATWYFLPIFPQIESALKSMDKHARASTIPTSSCTTGGAATPLQPAPWNNSPLIDALTIPLTLPRVVLKPKSKTKPTPNTTGTRFDNRVNKEKPYFARSGKVSPEGILHNAWRQAIEQDSTFIIINCGSYERIGFRHRATQTLYLSDLIEVWKGKPAYGKVHMGLQMAIIRDTIDRYKQRISRVPSKKTTKKRRNATGEAPEPKRRSRRQRYKTLQSEVVKTRENNGATDIWNAIDRPCALVRLQYSPFNSPSPSAFLRIGQSLSPQVVVETPPYEWKTHFEDSECFSITFNSLLCGGAVGFIHSGTLEVLSEGQTLRHEVVIKVATHAPSRKRLVREFSMYMHLWSHKVDGVPIIYGLFEDYDNLATILVLERAGVSLRMRQPHPPEDGIQKVVGLTPKEIADCVEIVQNIHKAGILHRDLRMDNIVFVPEGKPKIIDFDRARFTTSEQETQTEMYYLNRYLSGLEPFSERVDINDDYD